MERENEEDKQNIILNNQSTISPTCDEQKRHAWSFSDNNSASDECNK